MLNKKSKKDNFSRKIACREVGAPSITPHFRTSVPELSGRQILGQII